jgi:hypothetical protein
MLFLRRRHIFKLPITLIARHNCGKGADLSGNKHLVPLFYRYVC